MKMYRFWILNLLFAISFSSVMAGCSGKTEDEAGTSGKDEGKVKISSEPATLKVFIITSLSDEEFSRFFAEPVHAKYPNITLEAIKGAKLSDLIVTGNIPDLIYTNANSLNEAILDMNVALDLQGLIKKFNFDLSRFQPNVISSVKDFGTNGEFYGIPFTLVNGALWYNKDIFDKFGVPYPKDGMTWDEAYVLAKTLTRNENSTQYRGLDPYFDNIWHIGSPLAIPVLDESGQKAIVSDRWKVPFETAMKFYEIPGNKPDKMLKAGSRINYFVKDRNLAMLPFWTANMIAALNNLKDLSFNWDVAQLPYFKETPNTNMQTEYHLLVVGSTTKYQDQAFQAMQVITSDEVQRSAARLGRVPVVVNPVIQKDFAADLTWAEGKHMQSIFKSTPAKRVKDQEYTRTVLDAIDRSFQDVYNGNTDINTALRQAEENANKAIAESMAK